MHPPAFRTQTPSQALPSGPPFLLADLVMLLRQGAVSRVEQLLGQGALVGRLPGAPEAASGPWAFRTRLAVQVPSLRLGEAGLAPDMLAWPLVRRGVTAVLRSAIRVGRSPANDVVIPHADVSKLHARLVPRDGGGLSVVDEGSLNGTQLNGRPLAKDVAMPLQSRDVLVLGTSLQLRLQYLALADLVAALAP